MKRLVDLAASLLGLVLLAPALLAIALLVRWDSPGPALFRHLRVGRNGRLFQMLKFRTMHDDHDRPSGEMTLRPGARVTRLGGFLRRHKLDELPQLFNVLVGDMSLVGPRPEVALYVARYPARDRAVVLSVRPGVTDLASLRFRDEADWLARARDPERAYLEKILPRKLRLNRYYVRRQSLCLDLGLIARTIFALLGGRAAASGAIVPMSWDGSDADGISAVGDSSQNPTTPFTQQ